MRLIALHLRAFGPFTDRRLNLSAGAEGLHVVYGLNEAGKSSALRALKGLLYGIDERTQDDFLHDKAQLRIGGRFRGADGTEFICYRRKGRKNTLLGPDEKPLPEDALSRLLGGVEERLFETLFGIDHAALVSGGRALLEERGREAEALFGSGLGSTAVHRLLADLDEETGDLFAPRSSKARINAEIRHLGQIEHSMRDLSLSARRWDEQRRAVEAAQRDLGELGEVLAEASGKRATLERIRRTLPALARRRQLREAIEDLGDVPALPNDFGEQREEAVSKRTLAREVRLKAASRIEDLKAKMVPLRVSEELVAEADAIEALRERLGSHRKAGGDRPGLEARRTGAEEAVRRILATVRPDLSLQDVDSLRPLLGRRRWANELGGRKEALEKDVARARRGLGETERELADKRRDLEAMCEVPNLDALRTAVETARRAGDLDGSITETSLDLAAHRDTAGRDLAALGLWAGDLENLVSAPFPAEPTIQRFETQFQERKEARRRLEQTLSDVQRERAETQEPLRAMQLAGAVPSETHLMAARARREEGWQLLRRQWIDGQDVTAEVLAYGQGRPLPEAFEGSIATADEVADRLRREAERVHQRAAAQAKLDACEKKASEAEVALRRSAEERRKIEQAWTKVWEPCGLSPLSPPEMRVWLGRVERLREKACQGDETVKRLDRLKAARTNHRRVLLRALEALARGAPAGGQEDALGPLLTYGEARLRDMHETARKRSALADRVSELEDEVRRLRTEVDAATEALNAWGSSLLVELGLKGEVAPGEVSDYVEALADAVGKADEAADLARRLEGIDEDATGFREDVKRLIRRLAPDLADEPVEAAVMELHARLSKQRQDKSRLEELKTQLDRTEREISEADATIQAADERLRELRRMARCELPEELQAVEGRRSDYRQFAASLQEVEADLTEAGDGLSIEALEKDAAPVD
jgi:uncharacterized protein YhaN